MLRLFTILINQVVCEHSHYYRNKYLSLKINAKGAPLFYKCFSMVGRLSIDYLRFLPNDVLLYYNGNSMKLKYSYLNKNCAPYWKFIVHAVQNNFLLICI